MSVACRAARAVPHPTVDRAAQFSKHFRHLVQQRHLLCNFRTTLHDDCGSTPALSGQIQALSGQRNLLIEIMMVAKGLPARSDAATPALRAAVAVTSTKT